jgi:hypothetical protein
MGKGAMSDRSEETSENGDIPRAVISPGEIK